MRKGRIWVKVIHKAGHADAGGPAGVARARTGMPER